MTRISNCIAWDMRGPGSANAHGFYIYAGSGRMHNCTVVDCEQGIAKGWGVIGAANCLAQDCDDGFFASGSWAAGTKNNASDIASDAPGTDPQTGTATFAGALDFHLAAGDTLCRGNGADLSSDGNYPITIDIDGDTRSAWDIGADEYVAGGPSVGSPIFGGALLDGVILGGSVVR
jgi:hypothetical protein